jgi:plasmid replication initiation protein
VSNDLIVKKNQLITSKYHLTLIQAKFISYMSSQINKDDDDFLTYDLKLNETLQLLGIDDRNYLKIRKALRRLLTTYFIIEDDKSIIEETTFLSYFKMTKSENSLQMRFDKSLKPFLLQLKANFTKLSLAKILKFNSSYTIRFYEILEFRATQYETYKNKNLLLFEYDLEELKEMLVGEYNEETEEIEIKKSYKLYANFKNKVLDVAYKELKEKGDYYFEYEPIKKGRAYSSIKFTIFKNGEKIKKDFHQKRKAMLQNSTIKALAQEQIRRIIERQGDKIKDKLKYEQKLFQLYLKGELNFDKDIQEVIQNMGVEFC